MFSRCALLLMVAMGLVAPAQAESLADTPRTRRLLELARAYLPGEWRWPSTEAPLKGAPKRELDQLLPVTVREQRTDYSCGAASLGILVSHHALNLDDARLEKLTGTTPGGVDPWQLVAAAKQLGFRVTEKYDARPDDVVAALAAGLPVMIDFQASYGPDDKKDGDWGHYSVVVACDAQDFLIADPSAVNPEHLRRIPRRDLPGVWWDTTVAGNKRFQGWMLTIEGGAASH